MTEQVKMIPIHDLYPFRDHPFYVRDDEAMESLRDSIREYGVLSPLLASEKAFAYKMKLEAIKHQGKATSSQVGMKSGRVQSMVIIGDHT